MRVSIAQQYKIVNKLIIDKKDASKKWFSIDFNGSFRQEKEPRSLNPDEIKLLSEWMHRESIEQFDRMDKKLMIEESKLKLKNPSPTKDPERFTSFIL